MSPDKDRLIDASLDLAWSHWVGLGVRGTATPPDTAVDPEALLYFTAFLVEYDPRLREEVADWWSKYESHVSRSRLSALEARFGERAATQLDALMDALRSARRTSGKSRLDHLATPARSLLRMRCAFGANARAEVLLELLMRGSDPDEGLTVLALSSLGYSKRNIAFVVDDLVMAGLLVATTEGNRVRYRLADAEGLERVLHPLPPAAGRWEFRLPILTTFLELGDRLRGRDAVVQGIEARKTLDRVRTLLVAAGLDGPSTATIAETYWPELQRWLIESVAAEHADSTRGIKGMIEGEWVPPKQEPRRPERFSSAVLPRTSASAADDTELVCLDLVQVSTVHPANDWLWAVLSTAGLHTYSHTIGLNNREPWRFVTWAFGAPRTYVAQYAEPLPYERVARTYGKAAAERARPDRPAVQLLLTLQPST